MPGSFRSHVTRAALLCSAVLLAPLAMADTSAPASSTAQPATTPAPAAATPTREQTRDEMRVRRHADHEAFFSARLAALHAGLQLKPEQEALWTPIETAIRGFGKLRAAHWAEREASMEDKGKGDDKGDDTTDALRKQADRLIARGNAMKSLADATGPLLGSLDADQKGRLPMLLDGLKPKRVLARAFALEDRRDDREAWHHGEHEGWARGMRHEHWAERGMREHDGMEDRRAERHDRDEERSGGDEGRGFEHGPHHHGWDGERAERDGMRGDEDMRGREDMRRGDRPMHHHDDDESDRT